ncbi:NB-ARC - like 10 [Theobroma cacao]|nr:NB-ARC - like 10 [Theobroma cacao]
MKNILIILDDVWEELELKAIGIPFGDDHKGLQNFFNRASSTTWALFKDKAGVEDDSPTLKVAKEFARECNGLPLTIVTVAKALKGKNLNGWIAANQRFKDSRHSDNQDVCGGIYSLGLSYDYLENDNIQSCFLLCSLFPEDYVIKIEMLIICEIGQELFSNVDSIEVLRREIHEAVTTLQQSSLLLKAYDEESVKMHDVIRDFGHLIVSRGENRFMVKDGLMKRSISESFECCTTISLWNIEINHLPNKVKFSKLKILFLKGKKSLRVPCAFFERMTTLRVLLLQDVVFTLEALQFLANLLTLCFINCKLQNISSLRNDGLKVMAL